MFYLISIALFFSVLVLSFIGTKWLIGYLTQKAILDHPNDRSSHSIPTPRGGGLVLIVLIIPLLFILNLIGPEPIDGFMVVLGSSCLLGGISWLDDLKNLGARVRFAVQFLCVLVCLLVLETPENGYLFGLLPIWIEKILLFFGWIWFINLFNFMDGIDGISGVEISSISIGLILISLLANLSPTLILSAIVIVAATLGFLKWNWHKAHIFMGDVGSVPIGFIIGWLLLTVAAEGFVIIALLLPLYYLCDATWTLGKRAVQRKKIWQAHREHLYQHAVQSGLSHDQVSLRILGLNVCLIILALLNLNGLYGPICLFAGLILTILLLINFGRRNIKP